jgi:hypothetical protein
MYAANSNVIRYATSADAMRARATIAHRAMPSLRDRLVTILPWGRPAPERAEQAA